MKKITALLLCLTLLLSLAGCGVKVEAQSLTEDIIPDKGISSLLVDENFKTAQLDFSAGLFGELYEGKNLLISPLSVTSCLAMAGIGAQGETLLEFTNLYGGLSPLQLAYYMPDYRRILESDSLKTANSAWYKNITEAQPAKPYLQEVVNYFDAQLYTVPFDKETVNQVNAWVEDATDGKIDKIADRFDPNTLLYLVNALSFEGDWEVIYKKSNIRKGDFTNISGKVMAVDMMHSNESVYLEDENTTGFLKPYEGGKFAFVALLPDKSVTLGDYIKELSAKKLKDLLDGRENMPVNTALPKFSAEYSAELKEPLSQMGLTTAFGGKADFSAMSRFGEPDLFIGSVLHKTYISVDGKGTKAGAVTSIAVNTKSAPDIGEKQVILDRPFIYMIIDTKTNLPVFMGSLCDL